MQERYTGSIGRLVVIAGPSGAGKSSFLNNPLRYLEPESYPVGLQPFHTFSERHIDVDKLRTFRKPWFDTLCLHVDLFQPVRRCEESINSYGDFCEWLTPEMYRQWGSLHQYVQQAEQLDIVTFFVRREVNFSRLVYDKGLATDSDGGRMLRRIAAICGDSRDASRLHRQVYQAWYQYASQLISYSSSVLDANADEYRFITTDTFLAELELGY